MSRDVEFLADVPEERVCEAFVDAISDLRGSRSGQPTTFDWRAVVQHMVDIVLPRGGPAVGEAKRLLSEQHFTEVVADDKRKVMAATWRLIGRGWVFPQLQGQHSSRISHLTLTEKGIRGLTERVDHAGRLGYLQRLLKGHPAIDDEVFARLQDAEACLDADLHRPAIVMMGIAAEVTTTAAHEVMRMMSLGKAKADQFKERLASIQGSLEQLLDVKPEEQHRLRMAFEAIETVRVLRNDAAHPGNEVPDHTIVRDRFGSMCLHLPVVWDVLILPNRAPPASSAPC